MDARKLVYSGIVAAFSMAAVGAQANSNELWWLPEAQGTVKCQGMTATGLVVQDYDVNFTFVAQTAWGSIVADGGWRQGSAALCVKGWGGAGLGVDPEASFCYEGPFFPESSSPLKGTMGLMAPYSDKYYVYSETLQLSVKPEGRSGKVKVEGKSIAVGMPDISGSVGESVSATCDWKLQGFAEPMF